MKVLIANDHAGVALKFALKRFLEEENIAVTNLGTDQLSSVDYPDLCQRATAEFLRQQEGRAPYAFGVLLCGTGIGMSIAANKVKGVRCALVHDAFSAALARRHNHANFLALGARRAEQATAATSELVPGEQQAIACLRAFLTARSEAGRHLRRLEKITLLEKSQAEEDHSQAAIPSAPKPFATERVQVKSAKTHQSH